MAKKATSRTTAKTDKKTPASSAAAKKTVASKSGGKRTTKSSGGLSGLFLPGGGDKQTAEEKALAHAVTAAGGTDKLLAILKHIEAAGGASAALGALEVYERMRRVLNPTNSDSASHPLFDSLASGEDKEDSKDS